MQGQRCPDFILSATSGKTFQLTETSKPLVIYFYPKDNTPGCTNESMAFRDLAPEFAALGTQIVGISRDNLKSHENFKAKYALPFELLSDAEETVCQLFAVLKPKNMYGKQLIGIERSTFVIDTQGDIARQWRAVKIPGHAEEVLAFVRSLAGG